MKKSFGSKGKKNHDSNDIDPKLWDRLVWQQALDKAMKKQRDKNNGDWKSH